MTQPRPNTWIDETVSQLLDSQQDLVAIKAADPLKIESSKAWVQQMGQLRGRPLIYPMSPTGRANGLFIEMKDGSVKMDLICGIGVHLFGYNHPQILKAQMLAASQAPAMQGTLMPGNEQKDLMERLIESSQGRFSAGWISTCGTMANELALKVVRQKKFPAYKIIALKQAFSGRSTAMQEITDEPKYREGQPTFDQAVHVPYFDPALSLEDNIQNTISQISKYLEREPGKFAAFMAEPVPGEGHGFLVAPKAWWMAVLDFVKAQGLAVWFDEIQTFGRTGEMWAFQKLGLQNFVDVATCAKPIQVGAVMWTADYQPKAGLIAGTFSGSTTSLAIGAKTLELLKTQNYLGAQGKIQAFENFVKADFEKRRANGKLKGLRIIGGMVAFEILDGKAESIKTFLDRLFEKGIIGFSAGKTPVVLRFLPPVGVITHEQWAQAMDVVEACL